MFESGYVIEAGLSFGHACCLILLSVENKMAPLSMLSKFRNYSFLTLKMTIAILTRIKRKGVLLEIKIQFGCHLEE